MQYLYQRLTTDRVADLEQLRHVFARAFGEDDAWSANKPSSSYLEKILADRNYIAVVAKESSGEVVGGLTAHVLPKIDHERSEIYLYDLAVAIGYRRQGIATQLITELKSIAKTFGAYTIFVQADNEDVEAVGLYTKLSSGRETNITHFDIDVPQGDTH